MMKKLLLPACVVIFCLALPACSINKMAISAVSDALTGSGSSDVFTGDNDPRLVGDALPFAIKMYESLLSTNPEHPGLILTTGSMFVMYANAFVQGPAEMLPLEQYEEKGFELGRAKLLYLRGVAILERGINKKYPGMLGEWGPEDNSDFAGALSTMKKDDVPLFYWYAAGTLSAYALDVFDISLGLRVPRLIAMMNRAYELDPDYNSGALDEFFLIIYSALPDGMGGDQELALVHYQRALEKSKGLSAAPYIAYAQSIAVKNQDYKGFKANLEAALDIDPAANPSNTLVTTINQRKARYLLEKAPDLFLEFEDEDFYDYGGYN
jgi:predicted anti-sigma-YlaC factor YlaD